MIRQGSRRPTFIPRTRCLSGILKQLKSSTASAIILRQVAPILQSFSMFTLSASEEGTDFGRGAFSCFLREKTWITLDEGRFFRLDHLYSWVPTIVPKRTQRGNSEGVKWRKCSVK